MPLLLENRETLLTPMTWFFPDWVYLVDPKDASVRLFEAQDLMFAIFQSKIISASAYLLAIKPK